MRSSSGLMETDMSAVLPLWDESENEWMTGAPWVWAAVAGVGPWTAVLALDQVECQCPKSRLPISTRST